MGLVTINNKNLSVVISTKGAELQSVRESDGTERLWQGDPAFWTGRAPIMFPICGGLREDAYYMDGIRYEMPKHGYARKAEWCVEEEGSNEATFLLTEQHPGFPFCFELRARYQLDGNSLEITYTVQNLDKRDFWFSIGSHEAWATPGGMEKYTIEFDRPERLEDYVLDGNLIKREPIVMAEDAKELQLKTELFAVDALVFPSLKSRSVTLKNTMNSKKICVEYDGMDVLMLWSKPGAEFICIEPWCNAPDFVDGDMRVEHKPGYIRLEPGKSALRKHRIIFE